MKTGKIIASVGFGKPAGVIKRRTVRDRLQQVVNLGQPMVIHGVSIDVRITERLLEK
jgi:hypothetical protein